MSCIHLCVLHDENISLKSLNKNMNFIHVSSYLIYMDRKLDHLARFVASMFEEFKV